MRHLESQKQLKKDRKERKALVVAMDKWSGAATAPKPNLPKFQPNNNFRDFLAFKDWERRWELYIVKLPQ